MPLLLAGLDDLDLCIVPVAHNRLLVGSLHDKPQPDVTTLNHASALCSDIFFISATPRTDEGLSEYIGRRSAEAILETVQDALAPLRRKPSTPATDSVPVERREHGDAVGFTYVLSAPDFEQAEKTAALQETVKRVVQALSEDMPLTSLAGVMFAHDYCGALAELDRGDPSLAPDLSQPRSYGQPVAKCVSVVRDGVPKSQLVFDATVGENLLSDSESERQTALHMLVCMLASVSHDELYARPFDTARHPFPDPLVALLHRASSSAPCRYFSARESAFASPEASKAYAELFRDSMATAREQIDQARLEYRSYGGLGGAIGRCTSARVKRSDPRGRVVRSPGWGNRGGVQRHNDGRRHHVS